MPLETSHNAGMRKRINIGLAALLLLMVGVIAWEGLREREPVYQGKRLSVWLEGIASEDSISPETETAIRAMGADAVPALLKMVRVRDSTVRRALSQLSSKLEWLRLHIHPVQEIQGRAYCAFRVLGPTAKPAVPQLAKLLDDDDPEIRCVAAACLGNLGPASQGAVPALVAYLSHGLKTKTAGQWDAHGRYFAAYALCQMGPAARPAIPQLIALTTFTNDSDWQARACAQATLIKLRGESLAPLAEALKDTSNPASWCLEKGGNALLYLGTNAEPLIPVLLGVLQQTNPDIQERAIEVLGKIHAHPEACIPAITPFLQSTNNHMREKSIDALRAFGAAARQRVVLSEIVRLLNDTDGFVRTRATNALRKIDPEAAAKAGVK
jgi:HEAT repeat protein